MKNTGSFFGSSLTPQQSQTTNASGFFQTNVTAQPQQSSLTGFSFNTAPDATPTSLSTEKVASSPFNNSAMQPTSSTGLFEKTSSDQAGQSNGLGGLLSSTTTNDRLQNKTTTSLFGSNSMNAGSLPTNTLGLNSSNQFSQSNTSGGFLNNSGSNATSQTTLPQSFFGTTSNTLTQGNPSSNLLSNSSTTAPTQTSGTGAFFATSATNTPNDSNSLFKTTTTTTGNQPFQLSESTNLFGTLPNNSGNRSTLGGNIFGTNSNTQTSSLTLPTNIFGTSQTNNTTQTNPSTLPSLTTTTEASQTAKPSTLSGSTPALNFGGNKDAAPLFSVSSVQNTTKETPAVNSGAMTGLFGSSSVAQQSNAAPSNVTGSSLFSSTSGQETKSSLTTLGLFSKTTPTFATSAVDPTKDSSLTTNSKQSSMTGDVTRSEKPLLEGTTSRENSTTTSAVPNTSLFQGHKPLSDSKTRNEPFASGQATNSLFDSTKINKPKEDSVSQSGGLFGKTQENVLTSSIDINKDNKGQAALFKGNESTSIECMKRSNTKNIGLNDPETGNSIKPSSDNVSKDNLNFADGTLDEYQYERIDQLLSQWDQRVKRQVADFQKYAKVVATLDLDLCHSVSTLETVERNQLAIEKKMWEINSSLDQIENQQVSLESCLENIQGVLESHMGDADTKHPLKGRLQTITTTLDDAETVVDQLTKEVNNIQEALHPGPLGDVITMLNLHQRSLDVLTEEAHQLRDCLSQIGHHDFTNSSNTTTT